MEHLVRVQNERDRRTLAWLRGHVGDAAIVAAAQRCGGLSKPYLSAVCPTLEVTVPAAWHRYAGSGQRLCAPLHRRLQHTLWQGATERLQCAPAAA
jgi:hypothetical protein